MYNIISIIDFFWIVIFYFLGYVLFPFMKILDYIDFQYSFDFFWYFFTVNYIIGIVIVFLLVIITSTIFFIIWKLFSSKNSWKSIYFEEKHKRYYLYYMKYIPYFWLVWNVILGMKYNIWFWEFFFKNIIWIIFWFLVNLLVVVCYAFIMNSFFDWNGFEDNREALITLNIISLSVFWIFSYFYWKKKS